MLTIVPIDGSVSPLSHLQYPRRDIPKASAADCWVYPAASRAAFKCFAKLVLPFFVMSGLYIWHILVTIGAFCHVIFCQYRRKPC